MLKAVIMGVAGCGKSSVGQAVADRMQTAYLDGDDLHPRSNIGKMATGTPLSDEDRGPWLAQVGAALAASTGPALMGCSALKRSYRDQIRASAQAQVVFVHLQGARDVIEARMSARQGHFMPVSLLDSQFATLEALQRDEHGVPIEIDQPFEQVVTAALRGLKPYMTP